MARKFTKRESAKARFHDSMVSHPNPSIRLAADQIALAAKAARKGNVQEFMTHIDLAHLYTSKVNFLNPVEDLD